MKTGIALSILALTVAIVASGCSQKSSSEEIPAHAKAARLAKEKTSERTTAMAAEKTTCANCGVVVSVREVDVEGQGSGLGVVAGGVAGGLVGNQVGQGTGRDLATVAGIVGGAIAGNTIEKKIKKTRLYDVTVRLENGEERVVRQRPLPGVTAGDKVRIEGNHVVRE